jgi:TonB family protein
MPPPEPDPPAESGDQEPSPAPAGLAPPRPDPEERRRRRRELPAIVVGVAVLHAALLAGLRGAIEAFAAAAPEAVPVQIVQLAAGSGGVPAELLPRTVAPAPVPELADPEPLAIDPEAPPAADQPAATAAPAGTPAIGEPGSGGAWGSGPETWGDVVLPVPLQTPRPLLTEEARRQGWSGVAQLEIMVDRGGEVSAVKVIEPLPYGLGAAVVETVERWSFQPARYLGAPVDLALRIQVRFDAPPTRPPADAPPGSPP